MIGFSSFGYWARIHPQLRWLEHRSPGRIRHANDSFRCSVKACWINLLYSQNREWHRTAAECRRCQAFISPSRDPLSDEQVMLLQPGLTRVADTGCSPRVRARCRPSRRGGVIALRTGTSSRSPEPDRVQWRYRASGISGGSGSRVRRESCRSTCCRRATKSSDS